MLSDVRRAAIERALKTLEAKPKYVHPMALITRVAGDDAAKEVTELAKEYREANKDAKENGGALLSDEAADYWQEAQGVLRYAKIALAGNDPNFRKEKSLARKCERLEESFDARVPDSDKRKFVQYDPQSLEAQDDRWNWTVDGVFPLLSPQFNESVPVENPVGEAQRVVLMGLLDERLPEEQVTNASRLSSMLMRFSEAHEAQVRKAGSVAFKKAQAAKKKAEAAKKQVIREAKIAAGDQQATKASRSQRLKAVDDLFAVPAKPKKGKSA